MWASLTTLSVARPECMREREFIRSRTSLVDQRAEVAARRRIQRRRRADDERVGGRCARGQAMPNAPAEFAAARSPTSSKQMPFGAFSDAPGRSWSSFIRLSRVSSRRPPLIISMRPSRMHMHLKKYLPSVVIRQMLFDGPALQVVGEHDVAYGEVAGPIVTPIGSTRTCRDED